jgi:hypothetical protein
MKVNDGLPLQDHVYTHYLQDITRRIRENAFQNRGRNCDLATLLAEVAELAYAGVGRHEHEPSIELVQIAGICVNWWIELARGEREVNDGSIP